MTTSNIKAYFVSDAHLGARFLKDNTKREKKFVSWLDMAARDATHIFLLGDIFDFWFEFGEIVPKGFVRTLGKLASLCDRGIDVHFFAGNHDRWSFGYLEKEVGVKFHPNELIIYLGEKCFYLHHGDGLGNFEKKYNILKKLFCSKTMQWLFKRLHPNFSMWLAHNWSSHSRLGQTRGKKEQFSGEDKEFQVRFAKDFLQMMFLDFFIFGHRHLPFDVPLSQKTRVIGLGDWVTHFSYAVFDGKELTLKKYS